jgi:biopolymer transport protein ExbD
VRPLLVVLAPVLLLFAGVQAGAQQPAAAAATFVVHVDAEGSLSVAGDATPLDDSSVVAQAAAALSRDADTLLVVEASSDAPQQGVIRASQLLQQSGARKISFRTSAPTQQ